MTSDPAGAGVPPRIRQLLKAAWEDLKPAQREWGNPAEASRLVDRLTRAAVTLNALNSTLAQAPVEVRSRLLPGLRDLRDAVLALEHDITFAASFLERCLVRRTGYSPEGWKPAAVAPNVAIEG